MERPTRREPRVQCAKDYLASAGGGFVSATSLTLQQPVATEGRIDAVRGQELAGVLRSYQ